MQTVCRRNGWGIGTNRRVTRRPALDHRFCEADHPFGPEATADGTSKTDQPQERRGAARCTGRDRACHRVMGTQKSAGGRFSRRTPGLLGVPGGSRVPSCFGETRKQSDWFGSIKRYDDRSSPHLDRATDYPDTLLATADATARRGVLPADRCGAAQMSRACA